MGYPIQDSGQPTVPGRLLGLVRTSPRLLLVEGGEVCDHAQLLADQNGGDTDDRLSQECQQALPSKQSRGLSDPYLDGQVEQVQVPVLARYTVLVDNGHGDGRQAVGGDRDGGIVLDLGERVWDHRSAESVRRSPLEEGILLFAERVAPVGHPQHEVIAFLVLCHSCGSFSSGSNTAMW